VRGYAYAMAMLLQCSAEGDKRLDIASTADNLDDNVELDGPWFGGRWGRERR